MTAENRIGVELEARKAQHKPFSPQWLNGLNDEEKQAVAAGEFGRGMHDSGAAYCTGVGSIGLSAHHL